MIQSIQLRLRLKKNESADGREYRATGFFYGLFIFAMLFSVFSGVNALNSGDLTGAVRALFESVLGIAGFQLRNAIVPEVERRAKFIDKLRKITPEELGFIFVFSFIGWIVLVAVQSVTISLYGKYAITGVPILSTVNFQSGTAIPLSLYQGLVNFSNVVNVAVNESLFFNAGLQVYIENFTKNQWVAIGGQAFVAGIFHVVYSGLPAVILAVAVSFVILGLLQYMSKSLEVPILTHFTADFV